MKFLLVDDEEVNRALVLMILQRMFSDAEFVQAETGKDALGILNEWPAEELLPDIIISDYQMPELDGLELLRAIRESPALEPLRFIMLSGMRNHTKLIEEVVFSGGRFLQKPFRVDELQQLVLEVLAAHKK